MYVVPPAFTEMGWKLVVAGGITVIETCADPFKEAVIVATSFATTVPAVALNVAGETLAGIVTEFGIDTIPLFEESMTNEPPTGADAERVTVQLDEAPEAKDVGEQCTIETAGGAETVGGV